MTTPVPPLIPGDFDSSSGNVAQNLLVNTVIGSTIILGSDSSLENKCVVTKLKSDGAIGANLLLKIIDVGGEARVTLVELGDSLGDPIIGVSANSVNAANLDVNVCIGGVFTVVVKDGDTVSIGDGLERSNAEDGRVQSYTGDEGMVGVALTSGTGDASGSVTVKAIFQKNETF